MNNELKDKILVLESEISRLNKRAIDGGQVCFLERLKNRGKI